MDFDRTKMNSFLNDFYETYLHNILLDIIDYFYLISDMIGGNARMRS